MTELRVLGREGWKCRPGANVQQAGSGDEGVKETDALGRTKRGCEKDGSEDRGRRLALKTGKLIEKASHFSAFVEEGKEEEEAEGNEERRGKEKRNRICHKKDNFISSKLRMWLCCKY